MKYIFLDIDGVLATNHEFMRNTQKFHSKNEWAKQLGVPYPWNADAVDVFNEILDATGAEIILSSDWKHHWSIEELGEIFKANGVKKSPIDTTEFHPVSMSWLEKNRMSDIEHYLRTHKFVEGEFDNPICDWVIIDDLNIGEFLPENLKDRFFRTYDNDGIKQTGLKDKIIKKLNNEH